MSDIYQWRDAAQTIVARIAASGHITILEDWHPDWPAALAANPEPYVPPAPLPDPVPAVVSRFQARAALMQIGKLQDAEAAVVATGDALVQMAWAEATEFRRTSPTINSLGAAIGLSATDIDDLFRAAAAIEV